MFFKKRKQEVRKCPNGHVLDPEWDHCPYCAGSQSGVFLDESRAGYRPEKDDGAPESPPSHGGPSLPPLDAPAPAPAPPAGVQDPRRTQTGPPAPPPHADPDMTQISRPGAAAPRPPGTIPRPLAAAPPGPAPGSGPPPLVEWSTAQGQPTRPTPPPLPPSQAQNPAPPSPLPSAGAGHAPGSLDEPTRILSAAPAGGGLTVAWLVAASGTLRGQDFRIPPGGTRIGRLTTCGICLPHSQDDGISKEHSEVRMVAGACVLVDLASANGTFVNDEHIAERALQDGDRVRLGLMEFVYKCLVL
jgi:pSer/pThr/pTyr-binding forkhead associated (FHA) protein